MNATSFTHTEAILSPSELPLNSFDPTVIETAKKVASLYTIYRPDFIGNILFPLNLIKEKKGVSSGI